MDKAVKLELLHSERDAECDPECEMTLARRELWRVETCSECRARNRRSLEHRGINV